LESICDGGRLRTLAILIPSYKEEARVVRRTLLSAALVEYPNRRVTLLIDDPPTPSDPDDKAGLLAARRLAGEICELLRKPAEKFQSALTGFEQRLSLGPVGVRDECHRIARLYEEAAQWLEGEALRHRAAERDHIDHTDRLFVERILLEPARAYREKARDIAAQDDLSVELLHREFRRLASLFRVEFASFERKRYQNLSHAANKAMNLNSYIGLLGKAVREVIRHDGLHLEQCEPADATHNLPDADYLITLDADSLLLSDYALRLVHVMEQPGNERLAVAQTPYSAVPGTRNILERVAGATTDIQHIIHQGFTHYQATFWVGANALLRRKALDDICVTVDERGCPVKVYIQDRTVIEDTESSVDLIERGWSLYNYPERLAYSATPPDFGALVIQRQRWANGGLIILPKLLRYLRRGPGRLRKLPEGLMRFTISPRWPGSASARFCCSRIRSTRACRACGCT
jgi:cellulose synthase (UDP-forming)